jgi:hypothetical protein
MAHFRYVKKVPAEKKKRMIQLSPSQPSLFRIVGRILLLAVFTVEHGPGPIDDLPTSNMVILPLWQLCQLTKRFVEKLGRAIQKKTQTIDDAIIILRMFNQNALSILHFLRAS